MSKRRSRAKAMQPQTQPLPDLPSWLLCSAIPTGKVAAEMNTMGVYTPNSQDTTPRAQAYREAKRRQKER